MNIFCAPNPKPVTMGRVFQTGVERVVTPERSPLNI
ncbi:hypothetical protein ACUOBA_18110 [Escherichia coli]